MVGQQVSHYQILEHLGGGGMGVVYKARDLKLDRTVALKFLPPELTRDPDAKRRFIHEARAASSLDHTNICTIHDIDETDDGRLFIVMAFYDGETVKKKIERAPLKLDEVLDIASQVAQGLAKAHKRDMIHRDIKPANVMVTVDGVAKLVDFGLARLAGMSALTRDGTTMGTLWYMSPEQARGEQADHRSDIWSLGVMIYEMVTGLAPFRGDYENAVVYGILNVQPEPMTALRTGVPSELERIAGKAMAKDPAERYQHADELLVDIRRLRKEGATAPPGVTPASTPSPPSPSETVSRRGPQWRGTVLGLAGALVAVAAFFVLKPVLFEDIVVSEPKPIAVISFANQTGDKSFDYLRDAIPNLLITSLEQSRYLRVMTWERMYDVLGQMGRKDVEMIDKDLGFEICRREGVLAVVIGSYTKAGETFATDVKVLDVNSKELLRSVSARGEGVQSILTAQIDELSREIARGVGFSKPAGEQKASGIAEVTTSSMDAYNYYLRGRLDLDRAYAKEAREFLKTAVALDSTFAMAYLLLAGANGILLDRDAQLAAIERAKALSSRAPEKERLLIESRYAAIVERDFVKSLALLEELAQKFPKEKQIRLSLGIAYKRANRIPEAGREIEQALLLDPDFGPAVNMQAYHYADQGLFDRALERFRHYARLSPGDANPFDSMGELHLIMGRIDESIGKYGEAIRVKPSFHSAYRSLAYLHALKGEYSTALRWIDSLSTIAPTPGIRVEAALWKVVYLKLTGRYRECENTLRLARGNVGRSVLGVMSAPTHWTGAWFNFDRGALDEARSGFESFAEVYSRANPHTPVDNAVLTDVHLGFLELRAGRMDSARARLLRTKARAGSAETLAEVLRMLAGLLEAEYLLVRGLPDSSIRVYRATDVIRPSLSIGWYLPLYNVPSLRDIVPRAFRQKGDLDSAIVEYERLLKFDPASKDRRLIHPLYYYRLAQLYQERGAVEKAGAGYRKFLDLWRHADSERPELVDARKRLGERNGKGPLR